MLCALRRGRRLQAPARLLEPPLRPRTNNQNSVKTPGAELCELCECAPCQCHKFSSRHVPLELNSQEQKRLGGPHLSTKNKEVCVWGVGSLRGVG